MPSLSPARTRPLPSSRLAVRRRLPQRPPRRSPQLVGQLGVLFGAVELALHLGRGAPDALAPAVDALQDVAALVLREELKVGGVLRVDAGLEARVLLLGAGLALGVGAGELRGVDGRGVDRRATEPVAQRDEHPLRGEVDLLGEADVRRHGALLGVAEGDEALDVGVHRLGAGQGSAEDVAHGGLGGVWGGGGHGGWEL